MIMLLQVYLKISLPVILYVAPEITIESPNKNRVGVFGL